MADPETKKSMSPSPTAKSSTPRRRTRCQHSRWRHGVRLNNRLRRGVDAALGGLTLLSPDPAKRVQAAQSVFKTHDETMLPWSTGRSRRRPTRREAGFHGARAAILLFKQDATIRKA